MQNDMRHTFIRLALLPAMLLAAGCSGDDVATDRGDSNNTFALSVQMPADGEQTRVGLTQKSGSKDMEATWQEGDQVQVIIVQGERQFDTGQSRVDDITANGKQATIYFPLPDGVDRTQPFNLYCFTGIRGHALNDGGVVTPLCNAELIRSSGSKFKAPMFCNVLTQYGQKPFVTFHHFGTYEVLHVSNEGSQTVTFAHRGFDISLPWYQASASLNPADDGGAISPQGEWDGDADSDEQTIPAGSEATFISWYIPSGYPITDARLLAGINGSLVKSTDTFTSTVSLQRKRAYHMYATWDGSQLVFKKSDNPDLSPGEAVDLGLPSGTLWASCNVGASSPEEYGLYFAWGETQGYTSDTSDGRSFDWASYKWCNGSYNTMTKYCINSGYGYNGFTDGLTELLPEDDAATANWGSPWRMPSLTQIEELLNSCTSTWTTQNGVNGRKFVGPNGGTIFLPAAGYRWVGELYLAGSDGYYWSSTLIESDPYLACGLFVSSGYADWDSYGYRDLGRTVRPVR